MVHFLLRRPIAVLMSFLAFVILGAVAYFTLPVSLLPDIAIPKITVQVTGEDVSARELENTVVAPVRRQLLQVGGLNDITSETRDGLGLIYLSFDFGVNTDLAFIEVNEKIDAAMGSLPKEVSRPKVIKASATDIPVFYIHMTLRDDAAFGESDDGRFLEMCNIAEGIVRRRIEQLPQVAMADVTGIPSQQVQLKPYHHILSMYGLTVRDIEQVLEANNVEPGSLVIRDGYYEYNVNVNAAPRSPEALGEIYLRCNDRLLQLHDLCDIRLTTAKESGCSYYQGRRAVTFAVIKQAAENMDDLKREVQNSLRRFERQYPDIAFSVSRNQTELLDYTIANLQQNLVLGFLLIFVVVFLFMGNVRSPLVIGISMAASVVIAFLFFYLFHVSMNIISLSGLIMAVGMMIDNAIIVTENITQHRERGLTLMRAAAKGTTEMIAPMLSSMLTTVAVFVPLVFISGIAGALFFDEAFAVSVGLLVSYLVGIWLLPVLYLLCYRVGLRHVHRSSRQRAQGWLERAYEAGIDWTFAHRGVCLTVFAVSLLACAPLFMCIRKERMPAMPQHELVARIVWNEPLHLHENRSRVNRMLQQLAASVKEHSAYLGQRDFLLEDDNPLEMNEAEVYVDVGDPETLPAVETGIRNWLAEHYPAATLRFFPAETLFERLFVSGEAEVEARLCSSNKQQNDDMTEIRNMERRLAEATGTETTPLAGMQQRMLILHRDKMLLYGVSYSDLTRALKTAFRNNKVTTLRSYQQYMPVVIVDDEKSLEQSLGEILIETSADSTGRKGNVPIRELLSLRYGEVPRMIHGAKNGEYIPYIIQETDEPEQLVERIREEVSQDSTWTVDFAGAFVSNARIMRELLVVLAVSLLLMFFILSAQFENFVQPLIVLTEIPIDTAFALLLLWATGNTLNLMSAIGIIASCGIIINDSILKLDAIAGLQRAGWPLHEAIHEAGRRRLRAIVMTSLTTVFAMLPLLFTHDMGSEIQRPLAIAMIGTMCIGTCVSLFFIPLVYELVNRHRS